MDKIWAYKKSLDDAMKEFLIAHGVTEDEAEELYQKDKLDLGLIKLGLHDEFFDKWLKKNESFEDTEVQNTAVDNNEAMVEELQTALKQVKDLQEQLIELQEKLSVSYAKESKLEEQMQKKESAIANLTKTANTATALKERVESLKSDNRLLEAKLNESNDTINKLHSSLKANKESRKSLREELSSKEKSTKSLTEEVSRLKNDNTKLNESIESLKKDIELKKSDYSKRLEQSNKLVEKYKRIASKSVDRYIESQAVRLGVGKEEIKNKLPESYSFEDIDKACDSLQQYKRNMNKLPFNTMLNEGMKIKATPSPEPILRSTDGYDDEIDDQLLRLVKLY